MSVRLDGVFTFRERLGIFFTIEASSLSLVASTGILCYATYRSAKKALYKWSGREVIILSDASDSSLFINLMVADMVQAIGNFPNIRWMNDGKITEGSLCTAQAAIKQLGIVAVAMTSLAIAIQTFGVLALRWKIHRHAGKCIIVFVWIFSALTMGIGNAVHRNDPYYGDTGYWCWIREPYKTAQLLTEYLWVWLAGVMMAILYGIMALVMRGILVIDKGLHLRNNRDRVKLDLSAAGSEEERRAKDIANLMLFYPAVYIFAVFPNTLARWLWFSGFRNIPSGFTLFGNSIFALSGFFNLVLFMFTRPQLVKGAPIYYPQDHRHAGAIVDIPLKEHQHMRKATRYGHLPNRDEPDFSDAEVGHLPDTGNGSKYFPEQDLLKSPHSEPRDLGHLPPT